MSRYKNPRKDHVYYVEYSLEDFCAFVVKVHVDDKVRFEQTAPISSRYGPFPTLAAARKDGIGACQGDINEIKRMIQDLRHEKVGVFR